MTEFVDRVSLDELDFGDDGLDQNDSAMTPAKLIGVALFGALAALTGYYVYAHLDSEKRTALRDCVISVAREQVSSLASADNNK